MYYKWQNTSRASNKCLWNQSNAIILLLLHFYCSFWKLQYFISAATTTNFFYTFHTTILPHKETWQFFFLLLLFWILHFHCVTESQQQTMEEATWLIHFSLLYQRKYITKLSSLISANLFKLLWFKFMQRMGRRKVLCCKKQQENSLLLQHCYIAGSYKTRPEVQHIWCVRSSHAGDGSHIEND